MVIITDRAMPTENQTNQRTRCIDENTAWEITTSTKTRRKYDTIVYRVI